MASSKDLDSVTAKSKIMNEIIPESPEKESENEDQNFYGPGTPRKDVSSQVYEKIPTFNSPRKALGIVNHNTSIFSLIKRKEMEDELVRDSKKTGKLIKYKKHKLSSLDNVRISLFHEKFKHELKDKSFSLSTKSFYGSSNKKDESFNLAPEIPINKHSLKKKRSPPSNKQSLKKPKNIKSGQINCGVGHGIKKPKHKKNFPKKDSESENENLNISITEKEFGVKTNKTDMNIDLNNTNERKNLEEYNPNKKFFKYKHCNISNSMTRDKKILFRLPAKVKSCFKNDSSHKYINKNSQNIKNIQNESFTKLIENQKLLRDDIKNPENNFNILKLSDKICINQENVSKRLQFLRSINYNDIEPEEKITICKDYNVNMNLKTLRNSNIDKISGNQYSTNFIKISKDINFSNMESNRKDNILENKQQLTHLALQNNNLNLNNITREISEVWNYKNEQSKNSNLTYNCTNFENINKLTESLENINKYLLENNCSSTNNNKIQLITKTKNCMDKLQTIYDENEFFTILDHDKKQKDIDDLLKILEDDCTDKISYEKDVNKQMQTSFSTEQNTIFKDTKIIYAIENIYKSIIKNNKDPVNIKEAISNNESKKIEPTSKKYSTFHESCLNDTILSDTNPEKNQCSTSINSVFNDKNHHQTEVHLCNECNLDYHIDDDKNDQNIHLNSHNSFQNLKFQDWKNQKVIFEDPTSNSKIILIGFSDLNFYRIIIVKVLKIINEELNLNVESFFNKDIKIYFYIKNQIIIGALVAEKIKKAFRIIPELVDLNCCTSEDSSAKCGVNIIWTLENYRRQGVATKLLDILRTTFYYNYTMTVDDIAFSVSTQSGKLFIKNYTKTNNFKVY